MDAHQKYLPNLPCKSQSNRFLAGTIMEFGIPDLFCHISKIETERQLFVPGEKDPLNADDELKIYGTFTSLLVNMRNDSGIAGASHEGRNYDEKMREFMKFTSDIMDLKTHKNHRADQG